jgi:hypothetical protein
MTPGFTNGADEEKNPANKPEQQKAAPPAVPGTPPHSKELKQGEPPTPPAGKVVAADSQKENKADPAKPKPALEAPKNAKKPEPPPPRPYPAGSVVGKITKIGDDGKSFTLEVHGKSVQPNINLNPYDAWYQQRELANPKLDPVDRQRRMYDAMRSRFHLKDEKQELEITLADEVKVRVPPKIEFDEKTGRPKRPVVKKDPKDPDRNLPGVKGTPDELTQDLWVSVSLGKTREKTPRVVATMVLVLGEDGGK